MTVPQVSENQPVVAPSNPRKLEDKAQYVASFPIGMTRIMRILIHDNYKYKHTHTHIYMLYIIMMIIIFSLLRGIIKHQQPPIRGVTFRGLNAIYTFFFASSRRFGNCGNSRISEKWKKFFSTFHIQKHQKTHSNVQNSQFFSAWEALRWRCAAICWWRAWSSLEDDHNCPVTSKSWKWLVNGG